MRYPAYIEGLVLASPAGLPAPPVNQSRGGQTGGTSTSWQERLLDAAWSANFTPGQAFRAWSYLRQNGATDVERIVERRFGKRWDKEENRLVASYLYHITAQPGSGEFAMNSLLIPLPSHEGRRAIYARRPILPLLGLFPKRVPVLVAFGEYDWLRPNDQDCRLLETAAKQEGLTLRMTSIPSAGHHLYLENASYFNSCVNGLYSNSS